MQNGWTAGDILTSKKGKRKMEQTLKEMRKAKNLRAEEAAVKMGVTLLTIYNWERGISFPKTAETQIKLAKLYGVKPEEIYKAWLKKNMEMREVA